MLTRNGRTDPVGCVLVLVDGAGERGLCAGGDIRALYDAALIGDLSVARRFLAAEYRLNARIAAYPKPYVAFMDGIVMGGGVGLSAHGSHRVATERSSIALPETGIGFLPDIGATWLLSRAPHQYGVQAALTAAPMGAHDAILCGLADVHVPSGDLAALAAGLAHCRDLAAVDACVGAHARPPAAGRLAPARRWIEPCYAGDDTEAIAASLAARDEPAAREGLVLLGRRSPLSLKVTLRALRAAPALASLEAALEQEYRLALALVAGHDFAEGVRAALVDKDRNPAWSPPHLRDVDRAMVDAVFAAPDHGGLGLHPPPPPPVCGMAEVHAFGLGKPGGPMHGLPRGPCP